MDSFKGKTTYTSKRGLFIYRHDSLTVRQVHSAIIWPGRNGPSDLSVQAKGECCSMSSQL